MSELIKFNGFERLILLFEVTLLLVLGHPGTFFSLPSLLPLSPLTLSFWKWNFSCKGDVQRRRGGGEKGNLNRIYLLIFVYIKWTNSVLGLGEGVSGIKRNKSAKVQLSERGWRAFKIVWLNSLIKVKEGHLEKGWENARNVLRTCYF